MKMEIEMEMGIGMEMETLDQRAQRQRRRADCTLEYLALLEEQDALKRRLNLLVRATWSTTLRPGAGNRMDGAPTRTDQLDIMQEVAQLTSRLRAIAQRLQDIVCEVWLLRTRDDTVPPATRLDTLRQPVAPQAQPLPQPRRRGTRRATHTRRSATV